uniref:Multidrug ABC transporter ATP-binding protein n=1 Tax=Thermosporothrix sp. COM3 TaxID=2490863 RepID=A0A455SP40_9CHLR|nr:multidrug ABC transporter ATP-binding protein [Thermosporothrix sp. COM3]
MNDYVAEMQQRSTGPSMSSSDIAIAIDHLTVSYGTSQVLNNLSLEVPTGSIFGFLGANGAGKTTTIKILLGFRRPTSGSARVLGYDVVSHHQEICQRVGYVSETNSLYDFLNIPQLCRLSRDLYRQWKQERVDHYIRLFALPLQKPIKQFSKGMKAQLALCLALGNDPDLLILDEPTTELDPVARQMFLSTLVKDVAAEGKTIFFSSHILSEVEAIADRVAVLHQGRIVLSEELDTLRDRQKMLCLIYEEQPPAEEITVLGRLPGVRALEREGRAVRLRVEGNTDTLIETIQARPYTLRDLQVVAVRLDELLLEYMKGENA